MDRTYNSSALSNSSQLEPENNAETPNLDSAIRNKRRALQIIGKTTHVKDPLSWTCETPQKYWIASADSTRLIQQMRESNKGIHRTNMREVLRYDKTFKGHIKSGITDISNDPQLETDIETSAYNSSGTPGNTYAQNAQMDEMAFKLSVVPEIKGVTAWLKSDAFTDASNFSAFVENTMEEQPKIIEGNSDETAGIREEPGQCSPISENSEESPLSGNIEDLDECILDSLEKKRSDDLTRQEILNENATSGMSSGINVDDAVSYPYQGSQQITSNKRDCSKNSRLKIPSKSGGYWVPPMKPLSDFMDFKLNEKDYEFTEQELEIVRRLDYFLACNFCYRGFNIILIILLFIGFSLLIIVPVLYFLNKFSSDIEFSHMLFFNLVDMFVLFAISSCASKEIRIDGHYAVRSYLKIYWHLIRRKIDKKFNNKYLFLDDWYGDDKYKFIRAKLYEISQLERELLEHELNETLNGGFEMV